jgi:hypothetical protein
VRWLRDHIAQQPRPSIYRRVKRWPVNLGRTRGGRRGRRTLARVNWCPMSWQARRQWFDGSKKPRRRDGKVKPRGRKAGRRRSPAGLSGSIAVTLVRWPEYFNGRAYLRRRAPSVYLVIPSTNWDGGGMNLSAGRSSSTSKPRWQPDPHRLLYHQSPYSVDLTEHLRVPFSPRFIWQHAQHSAAKL